MKKLLGLALVAALCAVLLCTGAMADTGAFTVTGGDEGTDYSYADGVLTILSSKSLTISNKDADTPTTDRIVIGSGVKANLTFAGVNIELGVKDGTNGVSAVTVPSGATLNLTLADGSVNTVVGDVNEEIIGSKIKNGAGIEAPAGATLTINCAHSGETGHVCGESCGSLTASGAARGTIYGYAAGIGGKNAAGGSITINGGNIKATGVGGAGIGGGGWDAGRSGGTIVINGGIIEANGGFRSAGIGGSGTGNGGSITINGGVVKATGDQNQGGAGIGSGWGDGGNIKITGGKVTAYGAEGGAGIGGGNGGDGSDITISGGTVTAYGAEGGAGIGGGWSGDGDEITISGGKVTAYGAEGGAGIGGGNGGDGGDITISGGTVIACGGEYTGTDESDEYDEYDEYYGPSGIGSGGVYVDTDDGETYDTEKPDPGTFSTGESGSAIIFAYGGRGENGDGEAFSADDTSGWSGLIFQGMVESYGADGWADKLSASGEVYGATFTLTGDLSIPDGHKLTVGEGKSLSISADKSLSIDAGAVLSIDVGGSLNNAGTIDGSGELQVRYDTDPMAAAQTLEPGGTLDLSVCLSSGVFEGNAPNNSVTFTRPEWSSSDDNVAEVDEKGRVTALVNGEAEISVGGVRVCSVTVRTSVTGVELDRDTLRLTVGDREQLTATVSPESATDKSLTWSSSDSEVASVDADGLVTAHKPGAAEITVTTGDGGFTASCTVSVIALNIPETHDITVIPGAGGTIRPSLSNASEGAVITLTVTPDEGYELAYVTVDGERIPGTSFTMPDHAVTVSAVFVAEGLPFADVAPGAWYYDAVSYVYANGLMEGVSDTLFDPNGGMTRAMVWAILARIDGETVTGSSWADTARAWAMAEGVSDGENASAPVTREQLVTMLWRFAGEPAVDFQLTAKDADAVSGWACEAMRWAAAEGIIEGDENGMISPADGATRAQCAAILMRYVELG